MNYTTTADGDQLHEMMAMEGHNGSGMPCMVTGGAGFIGSHVVDKLLHQGYQVIVYDNFSTGREEYLKQHEQNINFSLVKGDLLDLDQLCKAMRGVKIVFHLAANADVRGGILDTRIDLEQNTLATWNVLESMRRNQARDIVFASTGAVYGDARIVPTPEDHPLIQTSMYGASKLACEGMIEAYCEAFDFRSWIFRFVSVLGERYTHGCVFDFYKNLLHNPTTLHVLGDGKQKKSYIHVGDCVDAMFQAMQRANNKVNIFNIGTEEQATVDEIVDVLLTRLHLDNVRRIYAGGSRGWVGDAPNVLLDITRLKTLGVAPSTSIKDAIIKTVDFLEGHKHLLERD